MAAADADFSALEADLWRFSLALYAHDDVQAACLSLQDDFGLDVPMTLFCLWLGERRGAAPDGLVEAAACFSARWRRTAVAPLRAARRGLKQALADAEASDPTGFHAVLNVAVTDAAGLRARVKALELEAEKRQLAALARLGARCEARAGGAAADDAFGRYLVTGGERPLGGDPGSALARFEGAPRWRVLRRRAEALDVAPSPS